MKKKDISPKKSRRERENERAMSRRWRDDLTGSILEFMGDQGDYRRIELFHRAHLRVLVRKFRLEEGQFVISHPNEELDMYPKHMRSAIAAKFSESQELSLAEEDGVANYCELFSE